MRLTHPWVRAWCREALARIVEGRHIRAAILCGKLGLRARRDDLADAIAHLICAAELSA